MLLRFFLIWYNRDMRNSFAAVRCDENHPHWKNCTAREHPLYERGNDIRSEFERDYTRLLHCEAFSRLKHKTQVFFAPHNDHICTRMEHVLHVASVASTIAKYLGLNEQLTQAIAIGHDIGHAPFGHHGEDCLNALLAKDDDVRKKFWHERNSLFFADFIETLSGPDGTRMPLNLTYAVRDGLINHCGEIDQQNIRPRKEALDLYSIKKPGIIQPYTWEGCVVKIADKIAYLGRDIQDARTYHMLNMTSYRELREIVATTLGIEKKAAHAFRSGKAVNTTVLINDLIVDLCEQSLPETGLRFSEEYFRFLTALKRFCFAHIYSHWRIHAFENYAKEVLETIYSLLMNVHLYAKRGRAVQALRNYKTLCETFEAWLLRYTNYAPDYSPCSKSKLAVFDVLDAVSYEKCVIEYMSGMTDVFAMRVYEEIISF